MMKKIIKFLNDQDPFILISFGTTLGTLIVFGSILAFSYEHLPPQVPLFYSLPWGESYLASTSQLALLPAIIVLTTLVNLLITWHLHKSQLLLKRILFSSSAAVSLLLLITSVKIMFIFT